MLNRFGVAVLFASGLAAADDNLEKTIRELYASSQAAVRNARTPDDIRQALATFAPEWVGHMPAGETITLEFPRKEAQGILAIPPEKRPLFPQIDFVYIRETGWNVLVVYWNSRRMGGRVIGSLYRDTWVRAAN